MSVCGLCLKIDCRCAPRPRKRIEVTIGGTVRGVQVCAFLYVEKIIWLTTGANDEAVPENAIPEDFHYLKIHGDDGTFVFIPSHPKLSWWQRVKIRMAESKI